MATGQLYNSVAWQMTGEFREMRNGVVEVEWNRSWRNGMKCNYLLLLQNLELCETVEIKFLWRVDDILGRQRVRWKMKYKKIRLYRLYRTGGIEVKLQPLICVVGVAPPGPPYLSSSGRTIEIFDVPRTSSENDVGEISRTNSIRARAMSGTGTRRRGADPVVPTIYAIYPFVLALSSMIVL
ncbi:hypothetical protein PCH_Pc20g09650 [Penicillium rubens Wisconsin 54-1255]|uniref:Uncharacterized protein n=1 Tax=Penicillium rubens (strain ATCC 28089 / DSM 1075 / NRRL 1951 / Wisconsin 54-1255) TaxID=500485 RepID=B6HFC3_PENRW|nr:hypothetical protein PCH_Pc20g09650 [Penicillium rubens Wisconsin 54-1255]